MDPILDLDELEIILEDITEQIKIQIINHNRRGQLNHYLKQLPIKQDQILEKKEERPWKILVIGASSVRQKDLKGIITSSNLDPNRFEFVTNYDETKNYSFSKLAYNDRYQFILAGAIPHKAKGVEDDSSIISKIENNPEIYPPLIRILTQSGELKITKSSFKRALEENNI